MNLSIGTFLIYLFVVVAVFYKRKVIIHYLIETIKLGYDKIFKSKQKTPKTPNKAPKTPKCSVCGDTGFVLSYKNVRCSCKIVESWE